MSESLIGAVRGFLQGARALYGDGNQAAAPPPAPMSFGPFPSSATSGMSGLTAVAYDGAVDSVNAEVGARETNDWVVARLAKALTYSIEGSLRALERESDLFESSVAALGPLATTPMGTLALLAPAAGVVTSVGGQIANSSSLMGDLAKQVPGDDGREAAERKVVRKVRRSGEARAVLASRTQGSGSPLSALERALFRERLANYDGPVPGMDVALALHGKPYVWGGFTSRGLDCSGAVSAVVNRAVGLDPFADRTSTHTMDSWLAARGALPGLGPGLNIGVTDAGVGHTALTLPDGTNFESSGGRGVQVGGSVGADHPMFTRQWHIPLQRLVGGGGATVAV